MDLTIALIPYADEKRLKQIFKLSLSQLQVGFFIPLNFRCIISLCWYAIYILANSSLNVCECPNL